MKTYIQILGSGSRECGSHSLYYFLEQHRMLFNVSEGMQRLATQYRLKVSPSRLSAIFMTRLDWECFGGLPGLILTMGDTAKLSDEPSKVRIIGPKHLKHAIATMRPFLHRRDFAVEVEELCIENKISHWRDSKVDVDVWALELFAASSHDINTTDPEEEEEEYNETEKDLNVGNVECEEMEANHFLLRMFMSEFSVNVSQMEREERCEEYAGRLSKDVKYLGQRSMVYVVQGPTQPGKFDKSAAVARGLKPGPAFGQLSRGESVTLPNGEVIHPDCCVGPKRPSPAFMIIDIPTADMAHMAFSKKSDLIELMNQSSSRIEAVIHLLGEEVALDAEIMKKYQKLCVDLSEEYGEEKLKHFISAPNDAVLMTSSIALQKTLAKELAAPEYFRSGAQPPNFMECKNLIKPMDKICVSAEEPIEVVSGIDWVSALDSETDIATVPVEEHGMYLSTLGTGSAIPGKYRNVSSSFIESYDTNEMIFLDCGEMTIGQIHRLFGPKRADELLSRTTAILISHKHGDHHLGALSLIRRITLLRKDTRLLLIAPERFKVWLDEFSQVHDFGLTDLDFIACGDIRDNPLILKPSGTKIKSIDVDHCYEAFGFQITFPETDTCKARRIVYSGDTRPCDSIISHAHECDLLVHEATMANDLIHEAIIRKHCTIEEAIDVGVKAEVKATLLTHFSQRYAKGALTVDTDRYAMGVVMGVDLLRFPLEEFNIIAEYTKLLPTLLPVGDEPDKEE